MGIVDKIRRALENHKVSALKKKIARLETEAAKQGKTVESLTIVLNSTRKPGSLPNPNRFEFVLSDGTTNKTPKKTGKNPTRVAPVEESKPKPKPGSKPTLVGKSQGYEEKSVLVEDFEEADVKVFGVVRRDGAKDIVKVRAGKRSIPQAAVWWMESKEKVCKKCDVTATPPPNGPLVSFSVKAIKI